MDWMELSDSSRRNGELTMAKDPDLAVIRNLNGQLNEYKRVKTNTERQR
jgi:hypothetical protein